MANQHVDEVVAIALRRQQEAILERIAPELSDLDRIERTYFTYTGRKLPRVLPPLATPVASAPPTTASSDGPTAGTARERAPGLGRYRQGTVNDLMHRVFVANPGRVLSYRDILDAAAELGFVVPARSPDSAIRTAAQKLRADGVIELVERGRYRLLNADPTVHDDGAHIGELVDSGEVPANTRL